VQLYVTPLFWTTHVCYESEWMYSQDRPPIFGKIIARETEKWAKVIGAAKADGRRRWPGWGHRDGQLCHQGPSSECGISQ
jgi:hypothetical protein